MKEALRRVYARLFSRGMLSRVNGTALNWSLSAMGYNNSSSGFMSGEDFFVREILAPTRPRVSIDIGANIGQFSKKLLVQTTSKVIAFEPHPDNLKKLSRLEIQYPGRFHAYGLALSDSNVEAPLRFNSKALSQASLSSSVDNISYLSPTNEVEVPVRTLDSIWATIDVERLDFLKIDVEGLEKKVLDGAVGTIRELKPRFIQFEFNWHHLFEHTSVFQICSLFPGYHLYQLLPDGWVRRDEKSPTANTFLYANFVLSRE